MCITSQMSDADVSNQKNICKLVEETSILIEEHEKSNNDFLNGIKKVLETVKKHKEAWPFIQPVNESYAPRYYEFIFQPISISCMQTKIEKGDYSNLDQLEQDFALMVRNCETYNGQTSVYTRQAHCIWRSFCRAVKSHLCREVSLEEHQVFQYMMPARGGSGRARKKRAQAHAQRLRDCALQALYTATEEAIQAVHEMSISSPSTSIRFYDSSMDSSNSSSYGNREDQTENLTFKALNEWNDEIHRKGLAVVLPEDAVQVVCSPISEQWLTNYPDSQEDYKTVFNDHMGKNPAKRAEWKGVSSKRKAEEQTYLSKKTSAPRLVLKLSRYENDWRQIKDDSHLPQSKTSKSNLTSDVNPESSTNKMALFSIKSFSLTSQFTDENHLPLQQETS